MPITLSFWNRTVLPIFTWIRALRLMRRRELHREITRLQKKLVRMVISEKEKERKEFLNKLTRKGGSHATISFRFLSEATGSKEGFISKKKRAWICIGGRGKVPSGNEEKAVCTQTCVTTPGKDPKRV